jgi:hypothetical protein
MFPKQNKTNAGRETETLHQEIEDAISNLSKPMAGGNEKLICTTQGLTYRKCEAG